MTVLAWDDRNFEAGVDRGVLQFTGNPCVVWNGLMSVEEDANVGEVKSLYLDGVNYLNVLTGRFFSAAVSAFSAPKDFLEAQGLKPVIPGFQLAQQPKRRFNFSYRVLTENGYKLHLVYNCLANEPDRSHETMGESAEPSETSWIVNATPVVVPNYRPTAHFVVDSERASSANLLELENWLYGTPEDYPWFPTVTELLTIFGG